MRADAATSRGGRRLALAVGITTLLLSGFSLARAAASCTNAAVPGSAELQLMVDGKQRSALVHVPPGLPPGGRVPLVLALHGFGGSGAQMERYSGFSRVADRYGFLVAYPSSEGLSWNSTGSAELPDDVQFIGKLITYLGQTTCMDPDRVFATGVSNGGGMVALAGCELSAQIAAVAPLAGGYDGQPACRPARPLSVLEIHGTADPVAPYFGRRGRRTANGLPPYVNGWVQRDGCAPSPTVRRLAPRTTSYRWRGCASGVSVEHIRIRGGRHQWPGATPPDPGPPATICAACTIWSFLSGLRTGARAWPTSGGAGLPGDTSGRPGAESEPR